MRAIDTAPPQWLLLQARQEHLAPGLWQAAVGHILALLCGIEPAAGAAFALADALTGEEYLWRFPKGDFLSTRSASCDRHAAGYPLGFIYSADELQRALAGHPLCRDVTATGWLAAYALPRWDEHSRGSLIVSGASADPDRQRILSHLHSSARLLELVFGRDVAPHPEPVPLAPSGVDPAPPCSSVQRGPLGPDLEAGEGIEAGRMHRPQSPEQPFLTV